MTERVAITGMAVTTAYGVGCAALLSGVLSGVPAFRPVTRFDVSKRRTQVAATLPGDLDLTSALSETIASVGPGPVLLAVSSGVSLSVSPGVDHVLKVGFDGVSRPQPRDQHIARTYTSACVAASTAVADAASMIAHGEIDRAVVAAGYVVESVQFGLFDAGRALATDGAVRPFSAGRKGLLLGDGVAAISLAAEPVAREPLAWVTGWGRAGDAYHVCQPRPDGSGLARAIDRALSRAGIEAAELDYVNAHGSGSLQSDVAEARALPVGVPVSSTKSLHGQALEASPLIELITTVLAMNNGTLPVNAGYLGPDPDCAVELILDKPLVCTPRHGLVVNSAFGGANTALVVQAP